MKTRLILFLFVRSFYSFLSFVAAKEIIEFQFKLHGKIYSGIGEVSDGKSDLCCTVTQLQQVDEQKIESDENDQELRELANRFIGAKQLQVTDLTDLVIAPKMMPDYSFKDTNKTAWVQHNAIEIYPSDNNSTLKFSFRQTAPQYCNYKMTLNNRMYKGSAELMEVRGALSYFVPKTVESDEKDDKPDFEKFATTLKTQSKSLCKTVLVYHTCKYNQVASNEDKWVSVDVCKVSSLLRFFFTYSLESAQYKIVDEANKSDTRTRSVQVSRIGQPNAEQFAFLRIPEELTGFMCFKGFPIDTPKELEQQKRTVWVKIEELWWRVEWINPDNFGFLDSPFVGTFVPIASHIKHNVQLRVVVNTKPYVFPVEGTVTIETILSPIQKVLNRRAPDTWSRTLRLTNFVTSNTRELQDMLEALKRDGASISISMTRKETKTWWLLTKVKSDLNRSLNPFLVAVITEKNTEFPVLMFMQNTNKFVVYMEESKDFGNGEKFVNMPEVRVTKNTDGTLRTVYIPGLHFGTPSGKLMQTPLMIAAVTNTVITRAYDKEMFEIDNLNFSPVKISLFDDTSNKIIYKDPIIYDVNVMIVANKSLTSSPIPNDDYLSAKMSTFELLNKDSLKRTDNADSEEITPNIILELVKPKKFSYKIEDLLRQNSTVQLFVKSENNQYHRFLVTNKFVGAGFKFEGNLLYTIDDEVRFKIKYDLTTITGKVTVRKSSSMLQRSWNEVPSGWQGDLALTMFKPDEETFDVKSLVQTRLDAQTSIYIESSRWLLQKVETHLDWCWGSPFVGTLVAKHELHEKLVLMVRYDASDYYGSVSKDEHGHLKIETNKYGCILLHKKGPSIGDIIKYDKNPLELIKKLRYSAIGVQKLKYENFDAKNLTWTQIYIEKITEGSPVATFQYADQEERSANFKIKIEGEIKYNGKVKVLKSTSDYIKVSGVDVPGWNGRLSLVDIPDEPKFKQALIEPKAELSIFVNEVSYLFQIDNSPADLHIQGTIVAKHVNYQVFVVSKDGINYYGYIQQAVDGISLEIENQRSGESPALFKGSPIGNNTETNRLIDSKFQLYEFQLASIGLQKLERNLFNHSELDWSPIWIKSSKLKRGFVMVTYVKPEVYQVAYWLSEEFTKTEAAKSLPNNVSIQSPFNAQELLNPEQKPSEVILELDKKLPSAGILIGKEAKVKMFLRGGGGNMVTGWRRIIFTSAYMDNELNLVGKIQPLQFPLHIIFWIESNNTNTPNIIYLLDGYLDEKKKTITFRGDAKATTFNMKNTKLFNWKDCLRSQDIRALYNFGMHRYAREFSTSTGIQLNIKDQGVSKFGLMLHKASFWTANDPVVIEYTISNPQNLNSNFVR